MLDQALDAAEGLGKLEERCTRDELHGLFLRLHQERDHPAEVAHLARRDRVTRMCWQPGIEDILYARLPSEPVRDDVRVLAVPPHPDGKGLDAAEHEPAVEGTGYRAER